MITKKELLKNLDNGYMEDVAKEINRYGEMTHDNSWEETEGYYAGHNRVSCYKYYGMNFTIEKLNGEVRSIGYSPL
jgi:hypothetical protein